MGNDLLQIGQKEIRLLMHDFEHGVFEAFEFLVQDWLEHFHQLLLISVALLLLIG